MRKFVTSLAAVLLGLAISATAQAGGPKGGGGHGGGGSGHGGGVPTGGMKQGGIPGGQSGGWNEKSKADGWKQGGYAGASFDKYKGKLHVNYQNYHLTYGKQFKFGWCYPGKVHTHWSYWCFDLRYGCNIYYDPGVCVYYYWCVPDNCWYPVTYCPHGKYTW